MSSISILAQEPAKAAGGDLPFFMNPVVLIGLMAAFYLLVILPKSRRTQREAAAMLANVKAGAKIVTTSGIVGTVVKIKDGEDELTIRSEDAKIRILRSTISRVIADDAAAVGTSPVAVDVK